VLKKLGYNVISADSGEDAIKIFRQYPVEIGMLITDVVMPGISGQDLAGILLQENPELKIIYISGYTGDAVASHGVIEEGTDFLQKPFSVETLAAKIRQLLDK
jgi:two-component system cell cycle sensor histidine kinase/response regulator CckA